MPPADAVKALRTAVRERDFAPVYFLHGEDDYLKEIVAREIVDAAVDAATRDFNLDVRRGAELDAETLGCLLSTPPMMAERRVVVIRDVGALKKDARAMLDRYLKSPAADQVVVLTSPAGAKEDKALAGKNFAFHFEALTGARIPRWIEYYAKHELGCAITPEAIRLLQDAAGTELAQLKLELDKLGSFAAGGEITDAAVTAVVGVRRGETLGDFLDAIGRRDARAALALLPGLLQQPKVAAVPMVMALTTQTLALAYALPLRKRGVSGRRLVDEFYNLLKSGSNFPGRSWSDAVTAWSRVVDLWTPRLLDEALEALLEADTALKGSRLSSDEQLLSTLVLTLCSDRRRRAA